MEEHGNYWIEDISVLGSGTFGIVKKVVVHNKSKTKQTVYAKKEFKTDRLHDDEVEEFRERFKREVKYQANCKHSNIVPIVLYNLQADPPWFIMELAESNLQEILDKDDCVEGDRKLSTLEKREIFLMILNSVKHIHENNLLHRDIKPLNILKFSDGTYKLSDFGLVKNLDNNSQALTRLGQQLGTSRYMAPEAERGDYSQQSDIYALGIVLEDLSLDPECEHIVEKCTHRKPAKRYETIQSLINDFNKITAGSKSC